MFGPEKGSHVHSPTTVSDFGLRLSVSGPVFRVQINCHGARPVHQIISMIKWIRTSRLSTKNSLSVEGLLTNGLFESVKNRQSARSTSFLQSPQTSCKKHYTPDIPVQKLTKRYKPLEGGPLSSSVLHSSLELGGTKVYLP